MEKHWVSRRTKIVFALAFLSGAFTAYRVRTRVTNCKPAAIRNVEEQKLQLPRLPQPCAGDHALSVFERFVFMLFVASSAGTTSSFSSDWIVYNRIRALSNSSDTTTS